MVSYGKKQGIHRRVLRREWKNRQGSDSQYPERQRTSDMGTPHNRPADLKVDLGGRRNASKGVVGRGWVGNKNR